MSQGIRRFVRRLCLDITTRRQSVYKLIQTGKCRGYGFVEFACDEVAKIAAQTMNNYLMFNKLLKCKQRRNKVASYVKFTFVCRSVCGSRESS